MKSTLFIALISLALYSCNIFDNKPKTNPTPKLELISLKASNLYTIVGSEIPIKLSISGKLENGITALGFDYTLYVNDKETTILDSFSYDEPGFYEIYAESDGVRSDTLQIEVRRTVQYEPKEFNIIFHIVHDGEEIGEGYNISSDRIDYQMSILKAVFEKQDLSFTTNSTHPAMFFKLANVDPEGNSLPEPGINRVQRPSQDHSILFEDWMWDYYWDPDYYINVWVGNTKNGFSWGIYPDLKCGFQLVGLGCTDSEEPATIQGIALELSNLWEGSWVFPHEMGHIFGLFHVFGPDNCSYDPDFVHDTPFYDRDAYIFHLDPNNSNQHILRKPCNESLSESYTSYNIMDYHYQPEEGRDLTYDQVERMRFVVDRGRFRASKDPETATPRAMIKPEEIKPIQKVN